MMNLSQYRNETYNIEQKLTEQITQLIYSNLHEFEVDDIKLRTAIAKEFNSKKVTTYYTELNSDMFRYDTDATKIGMFIQYFYQGKFSEDVVKIADDILKEYMVTGFTITIDYKPDEMGINHSEIKFLPLGEK